MTSLSLVVIRVTELERAQRFYEALGLRFNSERHGTGPEHLSAVLEGTTFEIYPLGQGGSTIGTRLGFRVDSVEAVVTTIEQAGGKLKSSPKVTPWGYVAVVTDPDGHSIEIVQGQ